MTTAGLSGVVSAKAPGCIGLDRTAHRVPPVEEGTSDLTRRFAELVAGPPDVLPLDEAILLVAAHDHLVDRRGAAGPSRCPRRPVPAGRSSRGVIDLLFGDEGFRGDDDDYHHPDNSFLDRVLDRRRGLPILLSIVTAEVAARCGVCLAPVGMPGHFLLRDCADDDAFIDPYHGGRSIDRAECERIFTQLHPHERFRDDYLDPVDNKAVLQRVLTNLVHTYTRRGPIGSLAWSLHLRALVVGGDAWLHVARIRERTGEWHRAAEAWDEVAAQSTADTDAAATATAKAAAARARSN